LGHHLGEFCFAFVGLGGIFSRRIGTVLAELGFFQQNSGKLAQNSEGILQEIFPKIRPQNFPARFSCKILWKFARRKFSEFSQKTQRLCAALLVSSRSPAHTHSHVSAVTSAPLWPTGDYYNYYHLGSSYFFLYLLPPPPSGAHYSAPVRASLDQAAEQPGNWAD